MRSINFLLTYLLTSACIGCWISLTTSPACLRCGLCTSVNTLCYLQRLMKRERITMMSMQGWGKLRMKLG